MKAKLKYIYIKVKPDLRYCGSVFLIIFTLLIFIQPIRYTSVSMQPTIMPGTLTVAKRVYNPSNLKRGDIITFIPSDRVAEISGFNKSDVGIILNAKYNMFCKRIIGMPGDEIEITEGKVYVNGKLLNEPYLPPETETWKSTHQIVGKDEFFVMGDNRDMSFDSRGFGPIKINSVISKHF